MRPRQRYPALNSLQTHLQISKNFELQLAGDFVSSSVLFIYRNDHAILESLASIESISLKSFPTSSSSAYIYTNLEYLFFKYFQYTTMGMKCKKKTKEKLKTRKKQQERIVSFA